MVRQSTSGRDGASSSLSAGWCRPDDDRAVSSTVGTIIVVALVLAGVGGMTYVGVSSVSDQSEIISLDIIENDMQELSAAIGKVAQSQQGSQTVTLGSDDLPDGGGIYAESDTGQIRVRVGSASAGWNTLADSPMGSVFFNGEDNAVIAYENGGVWRNRAGEGEQIIRTPPISVVNRSTATVNFPIFRVSSTDDVGGEAMLQLSGKTDLYPQLFVEEDDVIEVTIETEFTTAWGRYLENTFPSSATVSVDESAGTVTVRYGSGSEFYLHLTRYSVQITQ